MRTILRAALECIDKRPYWRTSELRALLLNLIADSEKEALEIEKVAHSKIKPLGAFFSKNQIKAIVLAAREENPQQLEEYLDQIFSNLTHDQS